MSIHRYLLLAALCLLPAGMALAARPQLFDVHLAAHVTAPQSGRLLIFLAPHDAAAHAATGGVPKAVDTDPFRPTHVWVAAQEVHHVEPGAVVTVDADLVAFPRAFSTLPRGRYDVQAVLDVHHDYNYGGRDGGDLLGPVQVVELGGGEVPTLTLGRTLPTHPLWWLPATAPAPWPQRMRQARTDTRVVDFISPALTAFWGRPIHMRALVLLPPGYAAHRRRHYPVVYFTHGFTGRLRSLTYTAANVDHFMRNGQMPPMIWVLLDEHSTTGTHEFADSVNNGPWGRALTAGLIPWLERHYRMDARARGRFLTGHSSGGWATLWLQTRYPRLFGGTWSVSPDPSDFHDFTGPDLYAPHANVYHRPDGTPWPLVRAHGKVIATFRQFARLERVLGPYGGQMASFDWVFSPRGRDGRPQPMFNRDTGAVNPAVVAYWGAHYDIARRVTRHWKALAPYLRGRIHVLVGTADTFYLDGSAHKLKAALARLHADADIRFLPGRTHFDMYVQHGDREALLKEIAWRMYAIARPHARLQPPSALARLPAGD